MAKAGPESLTAWVCIPALLRWNSRWSCPVVEPHEASCPIQPLFRNPFLTRIKIVLL